MTDEGSYKLEPIDLEVVSRSFPAAERAELEAVLAVLPPSSGSPYMFRSGLHVTWNVRARSVWIGTERLQTIYRIYNAVVPPDDVAGLSVKQRQMLACLFSRHHDGYVREKQIDGIISVDAAWTPIYLVQLLGEYVIEIAQAVLDAMPRLDRQAFAEFGHANADFIAITCERAPSYWTCYYRSNALREFPAFVVLNALGLWIEPLGRRWLRLRP